MLTIIRSALLAPILLALLASGAARADGINDEIVKFCKEKLGKQVGVGECCDLADEALKAAGAKPRTGFPEAPNQGDYVWGDSVYVISKMKDASAEERKGAGKPVQPGDVLQVRNARFQGKAGNGGFYTMKSEHHTAVVSEVREKGRVLVVFEQNVNGKRAVTRMSYRLADLKDGWIRVYRPTAQ